MVKGILSMPDWASIAAHVCACVLMYPISLLSVAGVLAVCGVPRDEIAKWALRQADRQRLADLIRLARGVPPSAQ
jgi:hypothetical protein